MIHQIIATWGFDEAKKREVLSRRCSKCYGLQVAGDDKLNEAVTCEKCGAEIPPNVSAGQKKNKQNNK